LGFAFCASPLPVGRRFTSHLSPALPTLPLSRVSRASPFGIHHAKPKTPNSKLKTPRLRRGIPKSNRNESLKVLEPVDRRLILPIFNIFSNFAIKTGRPAGATSCLFCGPPPDCASSAKVEVGNRRKGSARLGKRVGVSGCRGLGSRHFQANAWTTGDPTSPKDGVWRGRYFE